MPVIKIIASVVSLIFTSHVFSQNLSTTTDIANTQADLVLSFDQPGTDWESETLPIGNGALGASILGKVNTDVIQFNEKTLWTGGPNSIQGYDFGIPTAQENFPEKVKAITQLLQQKKILSPEFVAKKIGRDTKGYGSYQSFADIELTFEHELSQVSHYQRRLDLNTATAHVNYQYQGVNFSREYFVSYPDNVIVIKLSSSQPQQVNVLVDLVVPKNRTKTKQVELFPKGKVSKGNTHSLITVAGKLNDNNLAYESQLALIVEQGKITENATGKLQVTAANNVWLVVSAATNYKQRFPDYRGEMPHKKVSNIIKKALAFNYDALKQHHLADYQALFQRLAFNLDHLTAQHSSVLNVPQKPINQLLAEYKTGKLAAKESRALEVLYYQFGRYLLISSSRAGSLPANLQGVWNKDEFAPWSADYHVNINLQMNYWLADVTNLSETNQPLFDFIDSLIPPGELAAQRIFGVKGWAMFLNTNVWGFTGLIAWPTAFWQPEGAAWISLHYFEHYLFTQDVNFLKNSAYPVLKKATEFWLNTLVLDQSAAAYFVSPSYSPEHGDFTAGAAMSQQIVSKLLATTLFAARTLNDEKMIAKITAVNEKLDPGLRIGAWGQIQEWQQDLDDQTSKHRHVSQLYALHPSNSISPLFTPELAQAAKKSLIARGDEGTGWSKAWKINFWARLFDGNHAHKLLSEQLKNSTLSNLWDKHPPFQIDGNFGATAGISEMLLQSQNNEIHLLPALPNNWPNGAISGLKARGNIEVSISWKAGKLETAVIESALSQTLKVREKSLNSSSSVVDETGKAIACKFAQGLLVFSADKKTKYQIKP